MQCSFDIAPLFDREIIKVSADLLPEGFQGDAGQCSDAKSKIGWIIDAVGKLSGVAQNLRHPVTSVKQMARDQSIYLLGSQSQGKLLVSGLLKMGPKNLYIFDEHGQLRPCYGTPAILDFFVHGSQQRRGLGKRLINNMLSDLNLNLRNCAVDRPSAMMMSFLSRHYGLLRPIAQANKYVTFEGFFNQTEGEDSQPKPAPRPRLILSESSGERDLKVRSMAEIMEAGNARNTRQYKPMGISRSAHC